MRPSLVFMAPLILAGASCGESGPACGEPHAIIPIRALAGALAFQLDVPCAGACGGACQVEPGDGGAEVVVCRPSFREEGTPASEGSFIVITGDRVFEQQTTRRFVRIVSVSPPWSFAFWLPDARSLVVGEYGWSSPLLQQSMGTPAVDAGQCNPDSHADTRPIQGAIRVLSRTGGAEGADGVTDDYHAVVEVSGRFDAVPGHNNLGACLAAPATEFSFTYEEDEVFVTKVCQE